MRYDDKSEIKDVVAINIQAIASDTTTAGVEIDTQGFNSCTFVMQTGAVTAGDATLLIQDSDTSGSGYANVDDDFLSGTEASTKLDTANTVSSIGYVGKKRYVKASVVTDNSADLTVGAVALLAKGDVPVS